MWVGIACTKRGRSLLVARSKTHWNRSGCQVYGWACRPPAAAALSGSARPSPFDGPQAQSAGGDPGWAGRPFPPEAPSYHSAWKDPPSPPPAGAQLMLCLAKECLVLSDCRIIVVLFRVGKPVMGSNSLLAGKEREKTGASASDCRVCQLLCAVERERENKRGRTKEKPCITI